MRRSSKSPSVPSKKNLSTEKLAEQYLNRLMSRAWGYPASGSEPTVSDTDLGSISVRGPARAVAGGRRKSPTLAAFLSLLLPGGGFFYIGSPFLGSCFFFLMGLSVLAFGFSLGFVPHLLEPLGPLGLSARDPALIWGSGLAVLLIGWLNFVIPVSRSALTQTSTRRGHPMLSVFSVPFPVFGPYLTGRFALGHFEALCLCALVVSGLCARFFWMTEGSVEADWILAAAICVASGIGLGLGRFAGILGTFRKIGVVEERDAQSEGKFVVLGLSLLLVLAPLALFGPSGRYLQAGGIRFAAMAEERGFRATAGVTRDAVATWERGALKTRSLLNYF